MQASKRVEVLPFRSSEEFARKYIASIADGRFTSLRYPKSNALGAVLWSFWHSYVTRTRPKVSVNILSFTRLYLPLWKYDGVARFKCRINSDVRSYAVSTNDLAYAGFTWSPLDKLRVSLKPHELENLAPLEVAKHQKDGITVLPYTKSPLSLPPLLRRLLQRHTDPQQAQSDRLDPPCFRDDSVPPPVDIDSMRVMTIKFGADDKPSVEEDSDSDVTMQIDANSLSIHYAAYPIMLPIWLAKVRDETGDQADRTFVLRDDHLLPDGKLAWSHWDPCRWCGIEWWVPKVSWPTTARLSALSDDEAEPLLNTVISGSGINSFRDLKNVMVKIAQAAEHAAKESADKGEPDPPPTKFASAQDVRARLAGSFLLHNAIQRLANATPSNCLTADGVDSWMRNANVMKYSTHGQANSEFIDSLEEQFEEKQIDRMPKTLVKYKNVADKVT